MPPGEQLAHQLFGDGPALDQPGQQALAKQPHELQGVPLRRGMPGAIPPSAAIGGDEVEMGMPLQEVSRGGHGDDDPGTSVPGGGSRVGPAP
jgi:hypothetical protein